VFLELFLAASDYLYFCIANGYSTLHERRDLLSRHFFNSVLNKSSCLNYLLPDQRSDAITDKLRHPSIFKLPHVRTTRVKTSFVNHAIDHYLWFTVVLRNWCSMNVLMFLPRDATQSAVLLWQVVCLSVCLSVTLRYGDYIGWKSSKIISWLVSLGCSLFATPTSRGYSKGNTPEIFARIGVGCWKVGLSVQKL